MNILITGSRTNISKNDVFKELDKSINKSEDWIYTGGAVGVDSYTIDWCIENNVDYTIILPRNKSRKIDRLFRNCIMIGKCEKIIAFWDGISRGTKFTWDYARHYGLSGYMMKKDNWIINKSGENDEC